ncbi:fuconate dehydratase [Alphaproteobacteria bacterium]|nr:fuconate dehydratase [Alphaproteobacteria bacterium]MDC0543536.1 fuconate dehydratase [Alphaproteobacteria bacterium]
MAKIVKLTTYDLRFPTSDYLDGSDAMNPDPDYSAAYVIIETDQSSLKGHSFAFTLGRGNDLCCNAIKALQHLVIGLDLNWIRDNQSAFSRRMTSDSQLRWVGPEKGIIHMASGAIINAVWDILSKLDNKPLWQLVSDMNADQISNAIDFRHITDFLNQDEAVEILKSHQKTKLDRVSILENEGYPCYVTSAGWLGYSDKKLQRLCLEAKDNGFEYVKLKVGKDLKDDMRRLEIARTTLGPDIKIMIDANQVWEVGQAIKWMKSLAEFDPYFIEEPTSPDDIIGHKKIKDAIYPIKVATGEAVQNRVIFKQLISENAIDIVQVDACRMGGLNEVLAVQLMASKQGLPVWPHAGGVGLCEYSQHLAMIDYLCISGRRDEQVIEYVDHLHEHFLNPCQIKNAAYMLPKESGFSVEMKPSTLISNLFKV